MTIIAQTPTRRSKRFQPLATPSKETRESLDCEWTGEPIHSRSTILAYDILAEERDAYDENTNNDNDKEEHKTFFYGGFQSRYKKPRVFRSVRSGDGKDVNIGRKEVAVGSVQTFRVGDIVLVETDTLSRFRRPPSVAVIVSMWEVRTQGGVVYDQGNGNGMRIRVHWFLRPSELAGIRAKREHAENEIFYSLNSTETLVPEVILSHCKVTSIPPPPPPKVVKNKPVPSSPSKRQQQQQQQHHAEQQYVHDKASSTEPLKAEEGNQNGGKDVLERFFCRTAINSMRGLFYELDWDSHYNKALRSTTTATTSPSEVPATTEDTNWGLGTQWEVVPHTGTSKQRTMLQRQPGHEKDRASESAEEGGGTGDEYHASDVGADSGDDELLLGTAAEDELQEGESTTSDKDKPDPQTPSRKRRRRRRQSTKTVSTPRKARKTLVHPTPHSRRVLNSQGAGPGAPSRGRGKNFRMPAQPLTYTAYDLSHLPQDPWLRAMHVLHVGSRPDALPCRDEEFQRILGCVGELLEEGSAGCVYISGVPGTGKTATIHAVVRALKQMAENNEINPFTYVEINGLKIPEPSAAYSLLWEGVSGHDIAKDGHLRVSPKESLKALTRHFNGGGGKGRGPGGHACVVLMDELDQLVTSKQDVVYNFFNWPTLVDSKLVVIAVANTMDLPERVMTGRVRSRLGMIRINFQPYTTQQLEHIVSSRLASAKEGLEGVDGNAKDVIAADGIKFAAMKVSSISGDARRVLDICRRTVELVRAHKKTARTADVKEVIQAMQNSPTAAYIRDCSFHERLMLASMIKCMKREGVEEIKWEEIQHQHLIYTNVLPSESDHHSSSSSRKPTPAELRMVLDSLVATRALLIEDGAGIERKAEGERRVLLNLEQNEVERVLSEQGGVWKNVLS
ncbi:hypothetical protein AMATHDRAFT_150197 [Amanita thiersii Skay4041]|uniref:Origin recognition complex subunit 1 n=1 Tax=Amanita thiersii Skay4041 TaxID=703135 RepID=A0A2A9NCG7_9AGAR|nr:hypothetical protein AMATHDRAFT_150197 [Amanita thiersii Skay4041]